jgi:uncharacterized protein (TIGR03067 family)
MKLRIFPSLYLIICLLGTISGCKARTTLEDRLKPLQGQWDVVLLNRAGKERVGETLAGSFGSISQDSFRLVEEIRHGSMGKLVVEDYLVQLDPSKSSGEIDFVTPSGNEQGMTRLGIFALEGDRLKICMAAIGDPRPTDFVATEDPPCTLLEMRHK